MIDETLCSFGSSAKDLSSFAFSLAKKTMKKSPARRPCTTKELSLSLQTASCGGGAFSANKELQQRQLSASEKSK